MLKLISVNIERDKHHNTVLSFLEKEKADIVCLQEVFLKDLSIYEETLGMKSFFKPMCYFLSSTGEYELLGIAILTKQMANFNYQYIVGDEKEIQKFMHVKDDLKERNIINILIMWGDIEYDSQVYRISNIPLKYDSSIDPKLHRVSGLKFMVDGLFSTPQYLVSNVELVEGVSDHKAVVANLEKIS